mmetsp:Transcript_18215/g.43680  ORF Transcript_18215/g.43680 Transcript_18215/m.43680 type:complete len:298 (+) Transcript_18215:1429-2322(+)
MSPWPCSAGARWGGPGLCSCRRPSQVPAYRHRAAGDDDGEAAMQGRQSLGGEPQGDAQRAGEERHAGDRADAEDRDVGHLHHRRRQHAQGQQRQRCRARQAMQHPDQHACRRQPMGMAMRIARVGALGLGRSARGVRVPVKVRRSASMAMTVKVHALLVQAPCQPRAEHDQQHTDGLLEAEGPLRRNHPAEASHCSSHDEQHQRMAQAPGGAQTQRARQRVLARGQRRNGGQMVGIGGVLHSQQQPHPENHEDVHGGLRPDSAVPTGRCGASREASRTTRRARRPAWPTGAGSGWSG